MKHSYLPLILNSVLFFLLLNTNTFGQNYTEGFPTVEKGILLGPCPGGTAASCASIDFTGVNWTINGNFTGFDAVSGAEDYMKTIAGNFEFGGDIDEELCWESPLLDISATGSVDYSVFIVWNSQDLADYIDVEYQIDAGAWTQIPNQVGGGSHTIDYTTSGNSGSGTIAQMGISGSTLSVRVCVDTNTSGELTTIDNVLVTDATVLPVELISFNAKKSEDIVELNWSTATESDNEKFEIEYSTYGKEFKKIGEVMGRGTSVEITQYSFKHDNPNLGKNYYRLKQFDFDGRFEYSNVVNAIIENEGLEIGVLFPNPSTNGEVYLDYSVSRDLDLEFSIYNLAGDYVSSQKRSLLKEEKLLNFNFKNVPKGIYLVQIKNELVSVWRKLIIN